MTAVRARALAVLCIAAALVASGCGGDDDNSFKSQYNEKAKTFNKLGTDIQGATRNASSKSGADVRREFDSLATRTDAAIDDLAKLEPPSDAKSEFDNLITKFRGSVQSLRDVGAAVASGNSGQAKKATDQLVKVSNEVIAAEVALRRKIDK
jgi:hypothetical protein